MKNIALASMLFGATLAASVSMPAFAQDSNAEEPKVDTHLQVAMEVVEQTGNLPEYADQFGLIVRNSKNWLIRQNPNAEKEIIAAVDAAAESHANDREEMVKAVAQAWAAYLKEDELREVLAFFKTDAGQKFANYQPRILGESIGAVQNFSQLLTRVIVTQAKEDLEAKGLKFD